MKELTVKNFLGLNVRDSADKVQDNEFTLLQNVYQPTRGVLSRKFGSTQDLQASDVPLCSRISGVSRHPVYGNKNLTLYHCVPDGTALPDNTVDLTLQELVDGLGNIFGGGAIVDVRVCYSWIGCGLEQTYNSKNRAGYPAEGAFPLDAWNNPAHQKITLSNATSTIKVTVPAFPSGVRGANIFIAVGTSCEMTYYGTVTTSGGFLLIREFIGPSAALNDGFYGPLSAGTLTPLYNVANDVSSLYQQWLAAAAAAGVDPNDPKVVAALLTSVKTDVPVANAGSGVQALVEAAIALRAWKQAAGGAAGRLDNATTYDCVVVYADSAGHLMNASPVFSGSPSGVAGATALTLTLPAVPSGQSDGAFVIYFGAHGGTLYKIASGITTSTYVINQKPPTSGEVAPVNANLQPALLAASGGTLDPGTYYVAFAWVTGSTVQECDTTRLTTQLGVVGYVPVRSPRKVTLGKDDNAIKLFAPTTSSPNGAKSIYVFIGKNDPTVHPMTCVGIARINTTFTITSIPSHNAQTCPNLFGTDSASPTFCTQVNDFYIGGVLFKYKTAVQGRFGFMMAKRSDGSLVEIFPSRSIGTHVSANILNYVFAGDLPVQADLGVPLQMHNFAHQPKTQNDKYCSIYDVSRTFVQPYVWANKTVDPKFCYLLGISYFVNGSDLIWQTDGITLGQTGCVTGAAQTLLPPVASNIFAYQQSLVVSGALCGNQIYASNANAPSNWATGGSGSLLRFITIGDAQGSGVTAQGIFTPATEATNNPNSYLVGFKKVGVWMVNTIPDPTTSVLFGAAQPQVGAPMTQVSGKVGTLAPRSVVTTVLGTVFMGQDGNIYLINSIAEPRRIGNKIQPLLAHLVGNDTAMAACTAVFHDNRYKLCYPSPTNVSNSNYACDLQLWADLRTDEGTPIIWEGPHKGLSVGAQCVFEADGDDGSRLVALAGSVGTAKAEDKSTLGELGVTIPAIVRSKIYRLGAESHLKRILGAILDMFIDTSYTNDILFECFADSDYQAVNRRLSSGAGVWDVSQWDQANYADAEWMGFSFLFGSTNLTGRTLQFQITHSNQAPFVLSSVTPEVKVEKRRIVV